MLSPACPDPPVSLRFAGGEDPDPLDGSRGHRLPQVLLGQRRVELRDRHVGGAGLRGEALLEHDQPRCECCPTCPKPLLLPSPARPGRGLEQRHKDQLLSLLTSLQGCARPLCGDSSSSLHCTAFAVPWLPGVTRAHKLTQLLDSQSCPVPGDFSSQYKCRQGGHCQLSVCTVAVPNSAFLLAGEIQHMLCHISPSLEGVRASLGSLQPHCTSQPVPMLGVHPFCCPGEAAESLRLALSRCGLWVCLSCVQPLSPQE